ncbi:hypothetical protein M378DRAFT_158787 [Amanita muscaria Koide BX008]|uniref:Uncharacterized protein n=1 Tax=Amanita muscaria (strain Koide BX008) TaxID=946122 RepID=A0A0C2TM67_AMAMK|nr:hypothetical protein M378DRAFT_158787 [Amanita muscaria Koide BX008]
MLVTCTRERQREEDKKRKKKEKEEAKARERRKSFVGANPPVAFPTSAGPGYPTSPYLGSSPYATPNKPYSDLDRQFGDLDISGRPRTISGNYSSQPYGTTQGPQSRPYAAAGPHISSYANPSPNMRAADVLPNASTGYPASPYSSGKSVDHVAPIARAASPQPYGATTSAYGYPQPPRSRATTPIPGSVPAPAYPQPRSRAPSPMPAYPRSRPVSPMPTPALPSNQPTVPDGFSRPVNAGLTFPPFEPIKIHDMDDFLTRLPKLPMVLQPHDVSHHDWIRLTQVKKFGSGSSIKR